MGALASRLSWISPALFLIGTLVALLNNIKFGAIVMGVAIIVGVAADATDSRWRRPVALVAPLIIAVALITVALLLPRSSI